MRMGFVWLLPVAMAAAVYFPITGNYFFADDFYNFWYLVNEGPTRFVLLLHGGHSHVTRNLVIAFLHRVAGMEPWPYFWLLLLTHLLNVLLLYAAVSWLTGSRRVACLSAGLWGIAPVHRETVGWFAVYGQALAGTCALWVLAGLARCRAGGAVRSVTLWGWGLAMIVGALSFGVGIGVALAMPAMAWLLLPPGRRLRPVIVLTAAAALAVALYLGQQRLYQTLYAEPPSVPIMLFAGVWPIQLRFLVELIGYGALTLVLGPVSGLTGNPRAAAVVVVAAAVVLAAIAVGRAPSRTARPLLACVLFALGAYGMIVLGRAAFANLASDQWMAGKDRYQYVGSMAGAVALGVVASALVRGWRMAEWLKTGLVCAWAVAALAVTMTMAPPIDHHAIGRRETADALRVIDAVVAAKPPGRDVFITNRPFNSLVYPVPMETFPGWAAIFAIFHRDDVVDGRRVCFVISDARTLAAARHGRRAPALLCGLAKPTLH